MVIEKSVIISKPLSEVFAFLQMARNQDKFSVWNMTDPNQKVSTSGTDGTVGYIYSWDSENKNVGAGAQEITAIIPDKEITYELRFERPMKNTANAAFKLEESAPGQTKVSWNFVGETKFPMSLFAFIFKNMLGKDLAKSLENLKALLEAE